MEMRGRNGKWFGAGNRGTVWVVGVDIVFQFSPRVSQVGRGVDAFVVINVIEGCTQVSHHKCVGGENRGRSRRRSVNGEKGADCGEVTADFFFLDIEEASNVLNHLFVRESQLVAGRAVQRGRGNEVGGVASTVDRRGRMGWNENG